MNVLSCNDADTVIPHAILPIRRFIVCVGLLAMSVKTSVLLALTSVLVNTALSAPAWAQTVQTPTEFFGFEIGTDGELARYPEVLEYLKHLEGLTDRITYVHRGTTNEGNPYELVTISYQENLNRLQRIL